MGPVVGQEEMLNCSVGGVMEMFWNKRGVMVTQHQKCPKVSLMVPSKMVDFMWCELCLNNLFITSCKDENWMSRRLSWDLWHTRALHLLWSEACTIGKHWPCWKMLVFNWGPYGNRDWKRLAGTRGGSDFQSKVGIITLRASKLGWQEGIRPPCKCQ